jgi:hypothetical protein
MRGEATPRIVHLSSRELLDPIVLGFCVPETEREAVKATLGGDATPGVLPFPQRIRPEPLLPGGLRGPPGDPLGVCSGPPSGKDRRHGDRGA